MGYDPVRDAGRDPSASPSLPPFRARSPSAAHSNQAHYESQGPGPRYADDEQDGPSIERPARTGSIVDILNSSNRDVRESERPSSSASARSFDGPSDRYLDRSLPKTTSPLSHHSQPPRLPSPGGGYPPPRERESSASSLAISSVLNPSQGPTTPGSSGYQRPGSSSRKSSGRPDSAGYSYADQSRPSFGQTRVPSAEHHQSHPSVLHHGRSPSISDVRSLPPQGYGRSPGAVSTPGYSHYQPHPHTIVSTPGMRGSPSYSAAVLPPQAGGYFSGPSPGTMHQTAAPYTHLSPHSGPAALPAPFQMSSDGFRVPTLPARHSPETRFAAVPASVMSPSAPSYAWQDPRTGEIHPMASPAGGGYPPRASYPSASPQGYMGHRSSVPITPGSSEVPTASPRGVITPGRRSISYVAVTPGSNDAPVERSYFPSASVPDLRATPTFESVTQRRGSSGFMIPPAQDEGDDSLDRRSSTGSRMSIDARPVQEEQIKSDSSSSRRASEQPPSKKRSRKSTSGVDGGSSTQPAAKKRMGSISDADSSKDASAQGRGVIDDGSESAVVGALASEKGAGPPPPPVEKPMTALARKRAAKAAQAAQAAASNSSPSAAAKDGASVVASPSGPESSPSAQRQALGTIDSTSSPIGSTSSSTAVSAKPALDSRDSNKSTEPSDSPSRIASPATTLTGVATKSTGKVKAIDPEEMERLAARDNGSKKRSSISSASGRAEGPVTSKVKETSLSSIPLPASLPRRPQVAARTDTSDWASNEPSRSGSGREPPSSSSVPSLQVSSGREPLAYQPNRVTDPGLVRQPLSKDQLIALHDLIEERGANRLRRAWRQKEHREGRDGRDGFWETVVPTWGQRSFAASSESTPNDSRGQQGYTNGSSSRARQVEENEVARHYNSRQEVGTHARGYSPIAPLKYFNNWAKSVLIGTYGRRNGRIMDMGGGKGGDLQKWDKLHIDEMLLADIAEVSVQQAQDRYEKGRFGFHATFHALDCFGEELGDRIPRYLLEPGFDTVSLQFCMHYGWQSLPKARLVLENVSKYLRKGGMFIGTIPNPDELYRRRDTLLGQGEDELTFGNSIYHVTFEQKAKRKMFGDKYNFFLADAVDDVPEYVVDWSQFESLANEYGLSLVLRQPLGELWEENRHKPDFHNLAKRMNVAQNPRDTIQPMQDDLWEAVTIYLAFAFEKVR